MQLFPGWSSDTQGERPTPQLRFRAVLQAPWLSYSRRFHNKAVQEPDSILPHSVKGYRLPEIPAAFPCQTVARCAIEITAGYNKRFCCFYSVHLLYQRSRRLCRTLPSPKNSTPYCLSCQRSRLRLWGQGGDICAGTLLYIRPAEYSRQAESRQQSLSGSA